MDCGGEGSADRRGSVGRLCEEGQAVFQVEEQVRQSHPQLWKPGRLWSGSGMWDFVVSEVGPFRMEIGAGVWPWEWVTGEVVSSPVEVGGLPNRGSSLPRAPDSLCQEGACLYLHL